MDSYEDLDKRWAVLNHFVKPVAFFCMLQPSSFADRLALTAENTIHQANQRLFPGEADRLDQDDERGKKNGKNAKHDKGGNYLRRSDRRKQLSRLGKRWTSFGAFQQDWSALDGKDYRQLTRAYRNLISHSFSPRFMLGHVSRAIRSIEPWQQLVPQSDGTYQLVDHPTKKAVSYAMSSLEPLALDTAHTANLDEYRKAREAITRFAELVDQLCDQME